VLEAHAPSLCHRCLRSINPGSFATEFGFTMYARRVISLLQTVTLAVSRYQPSEGAEHGVEACSCEV
jgi:hypothetical protein